MILGYLDTNPKNIDLERQRQQILQYATDNNLTLDIFVQDSDVRALNDRLETHHHTVIIANIVALGTSLFAIKESISLLEKLGLTLISTKEGYFWKPEKMKTILTGIELAINIRNSLTSIVTRMALADKKAQGVILGRKTRNKKRALDDKQDEIISRKLKGESNLKIAKALGVTPTTLYAFYRQHPEIRKSIMGENNA